LFISLLQVAGNWLRVATVRTAIFRQSFYKGKYGSFSPVLACGIEFSILYMNWIWCVNFGLVVSLKIGGAGAKITWGFLRWWLAFNCG